MPLFLEEKAERPEQETSKHAHDTKPKGPPMHDGKNAVDSTDLPGELWKRIPGYPKYEASSMGRIRRHYFKMIAGRITPDGYRRIQLPGRVGYFRPRIWHAHRLILLAFQGHSPLEVHHKNAIRDDNRLENLEYTTQALNMSYRIMPRGEKSHKAKITEEDVIAIREAAMNGTTLTALARQYNLTITNISRIFHRKIWRHVK